jgi:hypothetical protein
MGHAPEPHERLPGLREAASRQSAHPDAERLRLLPTYCLISSFLCLCKFTSYVECGNGGLGVLWTGRLCPPGPWPWHSPSSLPADQSSNQQGALMAHVGQLLRGGRALRGGVSGGVGALAQPSCSGAVHATNCPWASSPQAAHTCSPSTSTRAPYILQQRLRLLGTWAGHTDEVQSAALSPAAPKYAVRKLTKGAAQPQGRLERSTQLDVCFEASRSSGPPSG